ncbi:MAG: Gfo/Idh/MocA family oxidoreductase [Ignavibacteriaceae bacterium]|nr:Gfo/Idh/MocA family oxidoreductase [Ignavibacteriaceae bacterium]
MKHTVTLKKLDPEIEIFALRSKASSTSMVGVKNIYDFNHLPGNIDFAIISNPTRYHVQTAYELAKLNIPLFIEKPVSDSVHDAIKLCELIQEKKIITYIACNLRFHPGVKFLHNEIKLNHPVEYNSYCGSYLPNWRPGTDYRAIYSASEDLGGGVHLDLIHEIDLAYYFFSEPLNTWSYKSKKSDLEITSMDIAHYCLEFERLSAFITLNYYRKESKRVIECVWENKVWELDLIKNEIKSGNGEIVYSEKYNVYSTYLDQMTYFIDCIQKDIMPMNNIMDGIKTLKICLS